MSTTEQPEPRTLADIAARLGATVVGDGGFVVRAVAHPMLAEGEDTLALAMDKGSFKALDASRARAAALAPGADLDLERFAGGVVFEQPRLALAHLLALFPRPVAYARGVHPTAIIDASAEVADDAAIGAYSVIGARARIGAGAILSSQVTIGADAVVGDGCFLHPGVRIGDRCTLGTGCILHFNVAVRTDGFDFVTPGESSVESAKRTGKVQARNTELVRINSIGNVTIGDGVEIGAGACIDRGTLGSTRIGSGTKIDNLVQIGHNVTVGENCMIAGQTGIAGSTRIGDRVVIGGHSGIADHLTVGDDAVITGMAGVITDIDAAKVYGGYPARPWKQTVALEMDYLRIGRALKDIQALSAKVKRLEQGD
ncbi:MAG: UDP-3-O-(3-hydroxymyristoyl)glucosamine N-acyltransferase [Bauldia litoralis]